MPGHKGMSKDNISSKIMDIKRLLSKQLCLFSLGFSFFNWFSIPSLFPTREQTLVSLGHVVTSIQPFLSIFIFRHQHLVPGVWWGLRRPHHPAGTSGEHILCPRRLQSQTVVSPLLCKTTDCSSVISTNKHLIVPLCVPSLCAGLRVFQLKTSARSRKWEGRKAGGGSEGGGQN